MKNTKVKIIKSLDALNDFLANNDVLNVQVLQRKNVRESIMRGGGMIEEEHLSWNVWYKEG